MTKGITVSEALDGAAGKLAKASPDTARLDASLLLAHTTGMERSLMVILPGKVLTNKQIEEFDSAVARRALHEPIAYIIGKKEFWSLDFYVTPDTLIPRPDSETLIEAALRRIKNRAGNTTILDIGTGTGCLLISLLKELPKASGVGVDINERALQVAKKNAQNLGVNERAEFLQSHWCDAIDRTFDLIISNPPYIAEMDQASLMQDVVGFEPHAALFAGPDGLDAYRALAPQMKKALNPSGMIVLEVGEHQALPVTALLQAEGLETELPEKDLAGIARCVIARRVN